MSKTNGLLFTLSKVTNAMEKKGKPVRGMKMTSSPDSTKIGRK